MCLNPGQLRFITMRYIEKATGDDAVDWAICELESGNDSDSLRRVAGERKPALLSELAPHLDIAYSSLGYDRLVAETIRLRYVTHLICQIAKEIIDGTRQPLRGRDDICEVFAWFSFDQLIDMFECVNEFEWFEMYNGFHPDSLDPTAEADLVPHILQYATKLVEKQNDQSLPVE
jgi:hypothetical protein